MADRIVIGVDAGSAHVTVAIAVPNADGTISIRGLGRTASEGISGGSVSNLEKVANNIVRAVTDAMRTTPGDNEYDDIYVGIGGKHLNFNSVVHGIVRSAPEEPAQLSDVVRLENEAKTSAKISEDVSLIHILPVYYGTGDGANHFDPIGLVGQRLDAQFNLITANKKEKASLEKAITRAKLNDVKFTSSGLAASLAVLTPEEMSMGVVLLDIGHSTTDMMVFVDGILRHMVVFPFGAHYLTKDIASGCGLPDKIAEQAKVKFGHAIPEQVDRNKYCSIETIKGRTPKEIWVVNLSRIIAARVEEMIEFIDFELLNSGYRDYIQAGIVLAGGGAKLEGICHLFESITGLLTRKADPAQHLAAPFITDLRDPSYATAIGLALQGHMKLDQRVLDQEHYAMAEDVRKSNSLSDKLMSTFKKGIKGVGDTVNVIMGDTDLPDRY